MISRSIPSVWASFSLPAATWSKSGNPGVFRLLLNWDGSCRICSFFHYANLNVSSHLRSQGSIEPVSECKYCLPQPTTGKGQPDGLAKTSPQRLGGKPDSMRTTAGMNPRVPPESRLASFHIWLPHCHQHPMTKLVVHIVSSLLKPKDSKTSQQVRNE